VRTRIALVAAVPVAFITLSMLSPAAPARSAKPTSDRSASKTTAVPIPANQLTAFHAAPLAPATRKQSTFPLDLSTTLLDVHPTQSATSDDASKTTSPPPTPPAAPAPVATPPTPPAPSGPVDTVTPLERAEWQRVAMCEEGGDWSAGGGRFSGGLGITRSNWVAYGGLEFAPEGAMATEDQQIMVAERIQFDPPDQSGCRGW
jgi:Transglycosylase-like domain